MSGYSKAPETRLPGPQSFVHSSNPAALDRPQGPHPQWNRRPDFEPCVDGFPTYGSMGVPGNAPSRPNRIDPSMAFYDPNGCVLRSLPTASETSVWDSKLAAVPPRISQDSLFSREPINTQAPEEETRGRAGSVPMSLSTCQSPRKLSNRDEFDGPHQFLNRPSADIIAAQERDLPHVPTSLLVQEQDDVLSRVNDRLSQCAFDFVAKYQFPIPLEKDKRPVQTPSDREWTEWVFLLKRLATKRRIPARVLYNGQIKQLVTVLENSLEMRHAAKHQSRPVKDDRNVLQLISAGLQVAKILKDAACMQYMDSLYLQTERVIQARKSNPGYLG